MNQIKFAAKLAVVILFFCVCACSSQSRLEDDMAIAKGAYSSGAGAKRMAVKAMPRDELQKCATMILLSNNRSQSIALENRLLNNERLKISTNQKIIEETRLQLDKRSAKQVNAFNAKIDAIRIDMRYFNSRVGTYNKEIEQINQLTNAYNIACANRPYRKVDLGILTLEQKEAFEKGAVPFDLPVYSDEPILQN